MEELKITGIGTEEQDYGRFCEHSKKKRKSSKGAPGSRPGSRPQSPIMTEAEKATAQHMPPSKVNATGGIGAAIPEPDAEGEAAEVENDPGGSPGDATKKKRGSWLGKLGKGGSNKDGKAPKKMKGAPAWWGDGDPSKKKPTGQTGPVDITEGAGGDVEDFVPDGNVDDFFGDEEAKTSAAVAAAMAEESDSEDEGGNSLVAAPEELDEADLAGALLEPEAEPIPLAATDDDDSDDEPASAGSDSEDELPDGWIDPKVSEQKAKEKEKQREEDAQKLAALRAAARQVDTAVASPEVDGLVAPEPAPAGQDDGDGYANLDDVETPAPKAVAETKAAAPAGDVVTEAPPAKKKGGGLSFAAYASPKEKLVVAAAEPKKEADEAEDGGDKKKKKKKKKDKEDKEGKSKKKDKSKDAAAKAETLEDSLPATNDAMFDNWSENPASRPACREVTLRLCLRLAHDPGLGEFAARF